MLNQKSSQSYAMKLFENLVEWQANKQIIIIISITEAELMTLSQMTCEEIYIWWMLEELKINLNQNNDVIIQCNNQQMLCLIQAEIGKLSIKLKHVDIQNHWLCQEYQWDCITVCYIKSKNMIVNDLMKIFLLNSHCWFLDQMNLIDIWDHLQDHQIQEVAATFESSESMNIDWILHESPVSEYYEKFWVWTEFYS